jgi:hypothetical protein
MHGDATDADIRGCFYDTLKGYQVIHRSCGLPCCGKPNSTDPNVGSIQCPNGCSGSWPFPGLLKGETNALIGGRTELTVAPITSGHPIMELVWDYTTKVPHSRFAEIKDPKALQKYKAGLLADARAKTRRS